MQDLEEIYKGCASLLKDLRKETGCSRERMAAELNVDTKTYAKFEAGTSAPRVPDFINLFSALGKDALRSVLDMVYPDIYEGLSAKSRHDEIRAAIVHYFSHIASDREVREISYMILGEDGSNWRPKLELFIKESHLSLRSRLLILYMINQLYELDEAAGALVGMDHIQHDEAMIRRVESKAREAFEAGRETYTTVISDL